MLTKERPLTERQRECLIAAEDTLFGDEKIVKGYGRSVPGLRKRGLVEGDIPHVYLTPAGKIEARRARGGQVLQARRIGDFYEFFGTDAEAASKALDIALTTRGEEPMCGIPIHAAHGYRETLEAAGFGVALLDREGWIAA